MGLRISEDVLAVLDAAEVEGTRLVLTGTLDRKLYQDVNKVLEAIGGKWNRSAKAHVFELPVSDVLEPIMETGEYQRTKQDFGQFDSPPEVVSEVIRLAQIEPGMDVLEPSAGIGNIVRGIVAAGGVPHAFEIDPIRRASLEASGLMTFPVASGDFLTFEPEEPTFDRVAMNPPFARQADIDHVLHAFQFLKPGGLLVSVMSASVLFRTNRKTVAFRELIADSGMIERLPDNAFASSGTNISTVVVRLAA
jgi:protein-L-isoaspartate O-methyltransferase